MDAKYFRDRLFAHMQQNDGTAFMTIVLTNGKEYSGFLGATVPYIDENAENILFFHEVSGSEDQPKETGRTIYVEISEIVAFALPPLRGQTY